MLILYYFIIHKQHSINMDLSFPIKDHLQEETYNDLLGAARHFNASRFTEANEILTDLLSKVENDTLESTLIKRAILTHW